MGAALTDGLADVVRGIDRRLLRDAPPEDARQLMTAAFVLTGLRLVSSQAVRIFQGVRTMRESTTYQYILDEGRTEARRAVLLDLGGQRLGPPDEAVRATVNGIDDPERLARMVHRVLQAASWQDLLATP
jgi:hypothetical protein